MFFSILAGEREKDKEGKGVPGDLIRLKFLGKQGKREFQKGQWGIKLAEKSRELRLKSSWGLSARGSLLILATAVPVKWWNQRPNCSSLRSARHIRKWKERTWSKKVRDREGGSHKNQRKT